jgi:hypothetical protein
MKTGDVLFWKGTGRFFERGIAVVTNSQWVHCGIAISPNYYVEAVRPMIRLGSIENAGDALIVSPPYEDEDAAYRAAERAVEYLRHPYDQIGVINVALCLMVTTWNRLPTWRLLEYRHSVRAWCSLLVRDCLSLGGISVDAPFACAPGHVAEALGVNIETTGKRHMLFPVVVYSVVMRRDN